MFDKLRKAFSSATKSIGQRDLSEKDLDNCLFDLHLGLLESDVAQEVIDDFSAKLKKELLGLKLEKDQNAEELIRSKFQTVITEMFAKTGKVDLINKIKVKRELKCGPFVVLFLGINGTGKTTTVAKIANLLRKNGISVVLAAADTHRAGAIEQLTQHAQKLALKVIAQRYGADPSAVGRDAVDYGRKHHIDAVLIDTAGRMQTAKNLMEEIGKIVKVVKPDLKIFIGDSLAGNDTINQAREFFEYTNFDGAILTKTDSDAKGGSAISIVYTTSKPIVYLGVGQGYDDIMPFDMGKFLQSVFWNTQITNVENSVHRLEQAYEPTGATVEPLSYDPSVRPVEMRNPITMGIKESKGDATPTKEEKSQSIMPIAEPEKKTQPAASDVESKSIGKSEEFETPYFEKAPTKEEKSQSIMPIAEPEKKTQPAASDVESKSIGKSEEFGTPYFEKDRREDEAPLKYEDTPIEKKKNRFSSFFSRRKNNKEPEKLQENDNYRKYEKEKMIERSNLNKDESRGKKDSKRGSGEKESQEKEHGNDKRVVYLTDEDIEDLLE
jgi:fused signal recognition particle receptor